MKVIYLSSEWMYINENDRIVRKEPGYEKGVVTSSLGYNHVLNLTFKLPKTIEKEMLEIEAEKYIFSEGSLDYSKEYKINYIFKEFEDYYNVEAFVVEVEILKSEFEQHLKIYKYIDFISMKPFVFGSFYEISKAIPQNDIFIYFTEKDAFLSCFENGEFVFVKTISKLSNLAQQLDRSGDEVIELLKTKGLNAELYDNADEYSVVESFFSQLFMKVNNLINYSVSYYNLSKINKIYFYAPFNIENLFESYSGFWDLSGIEFKKYELTTDYDPFDYTAAVYNARHYENEEENFSIFPKPVPFYRTKSGILFALIAVCMLVIGVDAYFKYQTLSQQQSQIRVLKKRIFKHQREVKLLKATINKYTQKVSALKTENSAIQKQISDISDKITYLQNIQLKEPFTNQLADITSGLKKYNLKVLSVQKEGSHTDLTIVSGFDNSSDVARFMKDMSKMGYKNITSSEIINNPDSNIYISKVSYDE